MLMGGWQGRGPASDGNRPAWHPEPQRAGEPPAGISVGRPVQERDVSLLVLHREAALDDALTGRLGGQLEPSGTLRYMISYMISCNYDIAYDIIGFKMSMIS